MSASTDRMCRPFDAMADFDRITEMEADMSGPLTEEQVRLFLRTACDGAGSQRQWAEMNGFSAAYVSDVLSGRRNISETLAKTLGYERVVSFERIRSRANKEE